MANTGAWNALPAFATTLIQGPEDENLMSVGCRLPDSAWCGSDHEQDREPHHEHDDSKERLRARSVLQVPPIQVADELGSTGQREQHDERRDVGDV